MINCVQTSSILTNSTRGIGIGRNASMPLYNLKKLLDYDARYYIPILGVPAARRVMVQGFHPPITGLRSNNQDK